MSEGVSAALQSLGGYPFTPSLLHSFTRNAPLLRRPRAVDRQRRAGDRACRVSGEKHRQRRHVFELDEFLARLALEDHIPDDVLARYGVHFRLIVDLFL